MVVADTSVWIEFLKGREPYYSALRALLEERQVLAVECIFGELLQGVKNNRERDIIKGYWISLPRADEPGQWIAAGEESGRKKLTDKGVGLIYVFIAGIARYHGARVWTLDKKLLKILPAAEKYG